MTHPNERTRRCRQGGWSIVELGVVILIIGLIAAVAAPQLSGFIRSGKLDALEEETVAVAESLDAYALGTGVPAGVTLRVDLGVSGPPLGAGAGTVQTIAKAQVGMSAFDGKNPYGGGYTAQLTAVGTGGKEHLIEVATCIDQKVSSSSSNRIVSIDCSATPECGGMCLVKYARTVVPSRDLGDIEAENELIYGDLPQMPPPPSPPPPPPPGKCAAPDTPIATPAGPTPIAWLRVGDLVYTEHAGAITAVPIRRVRSTAVTNHTMVSLRLDDGSAVSMSPGHPTADGRTFAGLRQGDWLGQRSVIAVKRTAYQGSYTFDILPDSDSGTYFASGALVGSTLR
ncbi:MAG: hypothetical protein V3T05_09930 [Myxococcota bacterium]